MYSIVWRCTCVPRWDLPPPVTLTNMTISQVDELLRYERVVEYRHFRGFGGNFVDKISHCNCNY